MGEKFLELVDAINLVIDDQEIKRLVEDWQISIEDAKKDADVWSKEFIEGAEKLDKKKLPTLLHWLCASEDNVKFMVFCLLLELKYKELPYITSLENMSFSEQKLKMLSSVLAKVASNSYNGIADCMYLILLYNDPTGEFLNKEDKKILINGINKKIPMLAKYLENKHDDEKANLALELLLDVSSFINDKETLKYVEGLRNMQLATGPSIFLIKSEVCNGLKIDENAMERLLQKGDTAYALFRVLEKIEKQNIIPAGRITMKDIAKAKMIEWLACPMELGEAPKEIELVDILEKDNMEYYIYKFKGNAEDDEEDEYMLGISGGFEKGKLTTEDSGDTFSGFDPIQPDYKKQAEEIIELIEVNWKNNMEE